MVTSTQPSAGKASAYAADIANVHEVALQGLADLAFWQERLQAHGLAPSAVQGQASLLVGATAASYYGWPFRELTITVAAAPPAGPAGFFLASAFNSSAAFAWVERQIFRTPYRPARIDLQTAPPPRLSLARAGSPLLSAAMAAARPPQAEQEEDWQGPVYLSAGKYFNARLAGLTRLYPFTPGDRLEICRGALPALDWLADSRFTPTAWRIRASARHARSPTYSR